MTLGPAILFLAFAENRTNKSVKIISVYGRVPMFYYLIHILLIHLFAMLAAELFTGLKGYGFSLPVVYLVWMMIVFILYPFCKRYDRYKFNHKEKWWLSYL